MTRLEPPPYQDGPRCPHGEPMALACRQCADPLTVEDPMYQPPVYQRPSWWDRLMGREHHDCEFCLMREAFPRLRVNHPPTTPPPVRIAHEPTSGNPGAVGARVVLWRLDPPRSRGRRPMHALRRLWRLLTTPMRPRRPGWDRRETR